MTLANLATVFGPNLLRPAFKADQPAAQVDVVTPVNVVLYYLNCPEEILDENFIRVSPTPTSGPSVRQDVKSKKKSLLVEEKDSGVQRRASQRTQSKRESII